MEALEARVKALEVQLDERVARIAQLEKKSASNTVTADTIKVVTVRCDTGQLLLDADKPTERWEHVQKALVIYLSFAKGARRERIPKVARTVLNLPLLTAGSQGWKQHKEASKAELPRSVLELLAEEKAAESQQAGDATSIGKVSVVVIPQAGLTSKIAGKTLKYHSQCDKSLGQDLYMQFLESLQACARDSLQQQAGDKGRKAPMSKEERAKLEAQRTAAAEVPPESLFKVGAYEGKFSAFDERGVPTVDASGAPVAKSQWKKLDKIYKAHVKKYAKRSAKPAGSTAPETTDKKKPNNEEQKEQQQPNQQPPVLHVVAGTFGGRQGFRMNSDCGPFTHMFTF